MHGLDKDRADDCAGGATAEYVLHSLVTAETNREHPPSFRDKLIGLLGCGVLPCDTLQNPVCYGALGRLASPI